MDYKTSLLPKVFPFPAPAMATYHLTWALLTISLALPLLKSPIFFPLCTMVHLSIGIPFCCLIILSTSHGSYILKTCLSQYVNTVKQLPKKICHQLVHRDGNEPEVYLEDGAIWKMGLSGIRALDLYKIYIYRLVDF